MTQPFSGIRIIDFTQGIGGPLATMLLADFGADVVKVEPPAGDRAAAEPGYLCWNRNKRRVTLDPRTFGGLRTARKLIETADVAVFDSRPGELERLGLDATTLLAEQPELLHVWMPPFGTKGRWSYLPPEELLLAGLSGVAHLQLSFADQPVALVTPQIGYAQGTIGANGIAAGLWERRQSGLGQALVVSGLHAVSSIEGGGAITAGGVLRLSRSSRGSAPHYRLYRCADGLWFFLGCLTQQFFLKALDAIGMMELMAMEGVDGEFANLFVSPGNAVAQEALEAKFAERPRAEWLQILHEAGVPRGPVGVREEWFRDETVASNEMRVVLDHPKLGPVEMPGISAKLSETPGTIRGFVSDAASLDVIAEARPGPPPGTGSRPPRPLAGVRVLDLGAFIAGTFAPTVLANYGAEIIKIEPASGDPFRAYGLMFTGHNLGKRSLALDLKHPEGMAVFHELVRQSDVVLDNYRLGVRERLGIDYASLSAINPRIITCSVTGYGPKGELAADPGFDPLLQARSGMMWAQGGGEEPVFHQIAVNDSATAMVAAFAIQAALHAREKTGRGQEVTTCLANQTILFQSGELTHYEGRPPAALGGVDFLGFSALNRYYACADGWLGLVCRQPAEFHALANGLGHPEWAGRTIAEKALQEPNDGQLASAIAETLKGMPRKEALERLAAAGIAAAPALRVEEIFGDPWLRENGFFQDFDDRQFGPVSSVRAYADWSRSAGGFEYNAPGMGEHSAEILREFGFGEGRVAELIAAGVVSVG